MTQPSLARVRIQQQLAEQGKRLAEISADALFRAESDRLTHDLVHRHGLLVDFSREKLDREAWHALFELADSANLKEAAEQLLSGAPINRSEGRAALHPACRAEADDGLPMPAPELMAALAAERKRMLQLSEAFRQGDLRGASGRPLRLLINIGIGGADLGVRLIASVFSASLPSGVRVCCVTGNEELQQVLSHAVAEETLLLINSKSFATREIMASAALAVQWLKDATGAGWKEHVAAVTATPEAAHNMGVPPDKVLRLLPEIGGRYSLWSVAGLAAAAVLGEADYLSLLAGARQADGELLRPLGRDNLPLRLALKDYWHRVVGGCTVRAFFPYRLVLAGLLPYLAQLEMESLGKSIDARTGEGAASGMIFWGGWGPGAQHSVFQMLYQGCHNVPVELLAVAGNPEHDERYAQCLAQAQALSQGYQGEDPERENTRTLPVTLQILERISPQIMGFLLGCWEHKVYLQAQLLGINPFDQWGVERGKQVSARYHDAGWQLTAGGGQDAATDALVRFGCDYADSF